MTAITPQEATKQLFEASEKGDLAAAKAAIAAGADANAKFTDKHTSLHFAAGYDHTDLVRLLIDSGAEINAKDAYLFTPLHWAVNKGCNDIARLLIDNGAEINVKNVSHIIPLHMATRNNNTALVKLLLSKGADLTLQDENGKTARQIADTYKIKSIAAILATAEAWHTHIKPLLGTDNQLDAGQLVDENGQPTEALKNLLPNDQFAALAKPGLYREGIDGVAKIYPHLPPAVQASIDLTDWRLSKLKEIETEPSAVQRYVRRRQSPLEKGRGNDDPQAGRS